MGGLFGGSKTITNTENKIGALRVQSSSQGLPIAIVCGKTRIPSNLIHYFDFTAIPKTEKKKSGKGGGGTTVKNTTYTYTVGSIFGLMEGPSVLSNFIGQIWSNKELTDATALGLTEFSGTYSQTPFAFMTSAHPTEARSYRGLAYAATAALQLGASDSIPNLTYEVSGFIDDADVNPAAVLDLLLTNENFGAGWPAAQLDSLTDWSNYCAAAGFLISPAYTAQRPMTEIVTELCRVGNAAPYWSEGLLKVKTYADQVVGAYTPDLTVAYNLTYDDFLASDGEPPIRITRKRQADAFNQVQIECLDRDNEYNSAVVEAKDQWNIDVFGLRPMEPIQAHAICDANVGRNVAQTILQRELYVRNVYEFVLGWRYARLEPMDICTLTDPLLGLDEAMVRITAIEENDNGDLAITAEDLTIGVSTPGAYAVQPTSGSTPAAGTDPGDTYPPVIFQPPLALSTTPQVWIGAQGGTNWGGAEVWVSTDGGGSYDQVGDITNPARYGVLTANLPVGADPDTTNTLAVNLTESRGALVTATTSTADALDTLSYVDGELIAYSDATLTSTYHYDLENYLRRGQAGSSISAHLTGSDFMRLDEAVSKFDVAPALFGTTIYIKLLSVNKQGGGLQDLSDVSAITFNVAAQYPTGSGFAFLVDRSTTTVADPGNGKLRFNNAAQSGATTVVFDAQTIDGANMVNYFASVGSTAKLDLRDLADTTKWATYAVTASNAPAGYQAFTVAYLAGGGEMPTGHTAVATFSPIGVTSVGLTLPVSLFSVSGSPVTTTGNLTASLITQNAAAFFAGPLTGNAAAPTFRAIAATDFNGGANASANTVLHGDLVWRAANANAGIGSIAMTVPSFLTVANSPLTANGTLAVSLATQNASQVFAGPASGNAAAPAFRALAGGDMPRLTVNTQTANYTLQLSDGNVAWVEMNSANARVVTIPSNANVAFPVGTSVLVNRYGSGNVTISAEANVTVHNASSNTIRVQYATVGLTQRAANEWTLFGDVT